MTVSGSGMQHSHRLKGRSWTNSALIILFVKSGRGLNLLEGTMITACGLDVIVVYYDSGDNFNILNKQHIQMFVLKTCVKCVNTCFGDFEHNLTVLGTPTITSLPTCPRL